MTKEAPIMHSLTRESTESKLLSKVKFRPRLSKDASHSQITQIDCLSRSCLFTFLFWLLSLGTCGLFALILYWFPKHNIYFVFSRVPLGEATHVAVHNEDGSVLISKLVKDVLNIKSQRKSVFLFNYRLIKFFLDAETMDQFQQLKFDLNNLSHAEIRAQFS